MFPVSDSPYHSSRYRSGHPTGHHGRCDCHHSPENPAQKDIEKKLSIRHSGKLLVNNYGKNNNDYV